MAVILEATRKHFSSPSQYLSMKNITSYFKNNLEYIISALGIFVVVVLLWAPFGLRTTDIADGWLNLPKVERNSFLSLLNSSRPLVYLPWKIASYISRGTYLGVQLVLAGIFWGKAFVLYVILRRLRLLSSPIAFLIAILFILYPADSGNFLMRALGRHTGVFFYFLAVLFLILASQHSTNTFYLGGMFIAEGISALISEQGFPLILVTPALVFLNSNCPKKRKVIISVIWYIVLILAVVNFVLAPKGHQEKILDVRISVGYIKEIILSNLVAYQRIFIDGWWRAIQQLTNTQWEYILFAFSLTIATGITSYLLIRFTKDYEAKVHNKHYFIGMIIASLVIIGLSFFPYSITSFRYVNSRVFYYAAAGGALTTGLIYFKFGQMLPRFNKIISTSIWGMTIFLISINGFGQHSRLVKRSLDQQKILIKIVEQAPSVKPHTFIVLVSGNKRPFTNLDYVFQAALSWTYQDPNIRAMQCNDFQECLSKNLPVGRAILFEFTEDGNLTLLDKLPAESQMASKYRPYAQIEDYVPFPEHAQRAFDIKPELNRIAPMDWESNGQTLNDRKVCDNSYTGDCSLLFYGDGALTTFSQQINISGGVGEHIELSFWAKSEKRITTSFPIATLTIYYDDGTQDILAADGQTNKIWGLQQFTFETKKSYSGLYLQLRPNIYSSLMWLDDIQLLQDNSDNIIQNSSFEK